MTLTNIGLVKFAEFICDYTKNCYMLGAYGQLVTTGLINQKCSQGGGVGTWNSRRKAGYESLIGQNAYAFDCSGLINAYLYNWNEGKLDGYFDHKYRNDKMMFNDATVKGTIDSIPEIPGIAVVMADHIGIYIGNQVVIESTSGIAYAKQIHGLGGVCRTKLHDREWTHWCYIPDLEYIKENIKPVGCIDTVQNYKGGLFVSGWAFDKDQLDKHCKIHVYVNDELSTVFDANQKRDDVNLAYKITGQHGFSGVFDPKIKGNHAIRFYAIDCDDSKLHTYLGEKWINITGERKLIEMLRGESFTLKTPVRVFRTANDARTNTNAVSTYIPSRYYIYNIAMGMVNISLYKGKPGGWINPADIGE